MIYRNASDKYRGSATYLGIPSQTVSFEEKLTDAWQAACMDAFADIASTQRVEKERDLRMYRILSPDFQIQDLAWLNDPLSLGKERESMYGAMTDIKHFPIMMRPVNAILGEMINRPENMYVVTESARARNEYWRLKGDMLENYVVGSIQQRVQAQLIRAGADPNSPEFQEQMQANTPQEIEDYLDKDYVDTVEQTSSRTVRNITKRESLIGKFINGFRHAVTVGKEFYHIYSVGGKAKVEEISPLDCFFHKSPSSGWISQGQYAGVDRYYTLASIVDIHRTTITAEEIEYLEERQNPSRKNKVGRSGISSITYNTDTYRDWWGNKFSDYDGRESMDRALDDFYSSGATGGFYNSYGLLRMVTAYWVSYQKIGFLSSYDDQDQEVVTYIDENYVPRKDEGEHVEWHYIKQIFRGSRVDDNVYLGVGPDPDQDFDENDPEANCLPIEGCLYNSFHTMPIGLVAMMAMWNELYNITAHELKKDMKKAVGKVLFMSYDHIPKVAGFTKEKWLYWLREFGIAWVGENHKSRSQFSHYSAQDLSLADQIAAKMEILDKIEQNCNSFAGFSQPRLAKMEQINTARQSQQSMASSANQTEYYFFKHYELRQRVYTKAVNIEHRYASENFNTRALYDDMEQRYLDTDAKTISGEKVGVYISNSREDLRKRDLMEESIASAIQNGADALDFGDLLWADTRSEIRGIYKRLRRMRDQNANAERELKTQEIQAKAQSEDKKIQLGYAKLANDKEIAFIKTFAFPDNDNLKDENDDNISDIFQFQEGIRKAEADLRKETNNTAKLALDAKKHDDGMKVEKEKLSNERRQQDIDLKNQDNDLQIERIRAKNRAKQKSK